MHLLRRSAIATVVTSLAMGSATAALGLIADGEYDLAALCGVDATLLVRNDGTALSVRGDAPVAIASERGDGTVDAANVITFGVLGVADDNVVHRITTDDGAACTSEVASDVEVALLLGLEPETDLSRFGAAPPTEELEADDEPPTEPVDEEASASAPSASEDSGSEASASEPSVSEESVSEESVSEDSVSEDSPSADSEESAPEDSVSEDAGASVD